MYKWICSNLSSFYRLESYQTRKKDYDEIAVEIVGELTPFERELLKRQEVVEIRGKVCLSLFWNPIIICLCIFTPKRLVKHMLLKSFKKIYWSIIFFFRNKMYLLKKWWSVPLKYLFYWFFLLRLVEGYLLFYHKMWRGQWPTCQMKMFVVRLEFKAAVHIYLLTQVSVIHFPGLAYLF